MRHEQRRESQRDDSEREQEGLDSRLPLHEEIALKQGEHVVLRVQANGLQRTLQWEIRGEPTRELTLENVTYLSDEGVSMGKRFTGATVGMYALAGAAAVFS